MNKVAHFYHEIIKLKTLLRKGWIKMGCTAERLESVGEHVFSCGILALAVSKDRKLKLNMEKALQMILVHDLGEVYVGDITPWDKEEKRCREFEAVKKIATEADLPDLLDLWVEFKEEKTPEARFCNDMDVLDRVMQAKEYSRLMNDPMIYQEFYGNAKDRIKDYLIYLDE